MVHTDEHHYVQYIYIYTCKSTITAVHAQQIALRLSRQEFDLGIGIVGLHQTGGVHLNPLQVDALGANGLMAMTDQLVAMRIPDML